MSLKREEVREWLLFHGINPAHVAREPGIRIVLSPTTDDAFIEVTQYMLDSNGRRFVDEATGEAAIDKTIIPLERMP